jgi:DNA-binding XRE family transcriptional regulator
MQTLKTITEALGITKKDIAKHCGVSNQSVVYWINGEIMPKPKNKAKIIELSKGIIKEEYFTNSWNECRKRLSFKK